MYWLSKLNEVERAEYVEKSITSDQKERAKLMEAILSYSSVAKARESKSQILREIKKLEDQEPIKFHNSLKPKPTNEVVFGDSYGTDLDEILSDMEWADEEDERFTFMQLSGWFEELTAHYENQYEEALNGGWKDDDSLPVTVGDIRRVYKHIGYLDGSDVTEFEGTNGDQDASTLDLTLLFDKLSEHYYGNYNKFILSKDDIKEDDEHALAVIFSKM